MMAMLGILAAHAGGLDLTNTSSTGCGSEWYGDCLPNDVWGGTDVLGIHTPTTVPVLTVGADPGAPTAIAVHGSMLNGNTALTFTVKGRALTSTTTVSMLVRYFNSSGTLIAANVEPIHSGAAGMFSVSAITTNIPNNAVAWVARLVVSGDAATFNEVEADCFFGGCSPPPPPPDEGPVDEDDECEDCDKDCGDYTATGTSCKGGACSAECNGVMGSADLAFMSGVDL